MKWIPLELDRSREISEQVDTVINTYTTLQRQLTQRRASNPPQVEKALAVLRRSFADRMEEMAIFYQQNDLDPRSGEIEAGRLKIKRFLHSLETSDVSREVEENASAILHSSDKKKNVDVYNTGIETIRRNLLEREKTNNETTVTIRVILTEAEYNEILARREAIRQLKLNTVLYNH
ncbi:uncharacterized protein TM35_000064330 [Trypanosoma theileri]|uniref:Uncharacterized protein n=1 Tax=Trypanosoma theileri TaxID=67003 RepID=A0A1X0P3N8_9TRYP|nr:uncharacterized protein TM35_000064330 [Trypanosoma theileri]ORC91428.1 hypothetical protein TM35_000064330 [Trypanosoma theileri]